jgi:hypothetical protein
MDGSQAGLRMQSQTKDARMSDRPSNAMSGAIAGCCLQISYVLVSMCQDPGQNSEWSAGCNGKGARLFVRPLVESCSYGPLTVSGIRALANANRCDSPANLLVLGPSTSKLTSLTTCAYNAKHQPKGHMHYTHLEMRIIAQFITLKSTVFYACIWWHVRSNRLSSGATHIYP